MSILKNHELFPQEGDEPAVEVESIQVYRIDRGARQFKGTIPAQDLTSEEQIQRLYGDGMFEIWARARNRITRKRTILFGDGAVQQAPIGHAGAPAYGPPQPDFNVQMLTLMMQSAQQQSTQIMTMMNGFMQAADSKNQQMMAMMMESSKMQVAVMTEFFKSSQQSASGASSAKEVFGMFKEGMQFAKENVSSLAKNTDKTGLNGTLDAAANMLGAISVAKQSGALSDLMGMLAPTGAPTTAPPAPSAPPPRALAAAPPVRPPAGAPQPPRVVPAPPLPPTATPPRPPSVPPPAAAAPSDLPSTPPPAHTAPTRTVVQVPNLRPRMPPPHGPTPPAESAHT